MPCPHVQEAHASFKLLWQGEGLADCKISPEASEGIVRARDGQRPKGQRFVDGAHPVGECLVYPEAGIVVWELPSGHRDEDGCVVDSIASGRESSD